MENESLLDRLNNWVKESIIIKLVSIGILLLILMLPSSWVSHLISERQSRADEVISEVSGKWAASQTLTGPVLMIPYKQIEKVDEWTGGVKYSRLIETTHKAYFVPEDLTINGTVSPEKLRRGIFDVAVYDSKVNLKSTFGNISFDKWNIPDEQVMWNDAALLMGIKDLQGIHENPKIRSGEMSFKSESLANVGLTISDYSSSTDYRGNRVESAVESPTTGIIVPFEWNSRADIIKDFTVELELKGSERLYFVPVGKSTSVSLTSNWPSPSFDGKMLPITREVTEQGFKATWKILAFNRPLPDQWADGEHSLSGTEFGVRLVIPADQYQKSMRTSKYDVLIILLAFTALFLVEITRKVRIHPFQYILVGVALIIYYTLLLSISEHLGYNIAYAISSTATVLLLT
jgi:inner membrane protein